ncbi:MAG: helix-turn-helix domain-containing protein [Hormoscilla sp. SP12CHS1]|nr:helix-turn-helix domain-containing protein [Hormoscilla sp. SP12CHS1]
MKIFDLSIVTIYNWFNAWEYLNLVGLYDIKGRRRKPKLNSEPKEQIVAWTKKYPKKIELVKEKAKENWNVSVSKDTIKRILKNENMSWRRIRKRVGGEPAHWCLSVRSASSLNRISIRFCSRSDFLL